MGSAFFTQVLFRDDGTFDRSTSNYESLDLAEQAFHVAMASAINKPEYNKAIMYVFNDAGVIKHKRIWVRGAQ